jgi:hypothetical protein
MRGVNASKFKEQCLSVLDHLDPEGHRRRPELGGVQPYHFESDPADDLPAATSVVHRVPLVTRDRKIRCSKLVPVTRA